MGSKTQGREAKWRDPFSSAGVGGRMGSGLYVEFLWDNFHFLCEGGAEVL